MLHFNTDIMKLKIFIIPASLMFNIAGAQNGPSSLMASQATLSPVSATPSTPIAFTDVTPVSGSAWDNENIMDYKSVYEAATLEDEVQMATERFNLTKHQQDVWRDAAFDRRQTEKLAHDKLDSKATDYSKDALFRGLRSSQNTFHEIIIGFLTPAQKQALDGDRAILHEKQRRLAKLPPPVVVPTVTVAPIDSTAIKAEEKAKAKTPEKKPKKKKKPA
jgi:hypothetical protein